MKLSTILISTRQKLDAFRKHITCWKDVYQITPSLVALLIAFLALLISYKANRLTATAVTVATNALELQRTEFKLRNRPVITIKNPQFTDSMTDAEGKVWPHSLAADINNISQIPAKNVLASVALSINGVNVQTTITHVQACSTGSDLDY